MARSTDVPGTADATLPDDGPRWATPRRRRGGRRAWQWGRYLVGLGLAALAVWAVTGKSGELSGATSYLDHLRWGWILAAAIFEAASYLSFASMQRRLLAAGGVNIPVLPMAAITVAGNAIQNSIPAGLVFSSAYAYRQFRRWGADEVLSAWVIVGMATVTMVSLAGLAAVGLGLAASTGSALDLVGVIAGVAAAAGAVVLAWIKRTYLIRRAAWVLRLSQRLLHRPGGEADRVVATALAQLARVAPSRHQWAAAAGYAVGNWTADMACLGLSFLAIGAGVPWRGLLLAYSAAQLATNLPITPGGLGVVEGSLTIALVAFGGAQASTVAAVLVYRLLSFWLMLPVGWGAWAATTWASRRPRQAFPADVVAP
ncbi:MAG: lysylphosphatidylglycerol synthase transmembrane domain-containing protein [Acidimicrobiales bacterium]